MGPDLIQGTTMNRFAQRLFACFFLLCGAAASALPQPAEQADVRRIEFNIAPQPMGKALNEFATQADVRIVFYPQVVEGLVAPRLSGSYSAEEALKILLGSSELRYRFTDARTVRIATSSAAEHPVSLEDEVPARGEPVRLAQVETDSDGSGSPTSSRSSAEAIDDSQGVKLEEVVVTAQKRAERLQDVPVPVSAIDADTLVGSHQLRLQDYYAKIPGLNLSLIGDGNAPTLSVRGVTTGGFTNPTVAIVVDEVSYGSSITAGNSHTAPDIDPSELARVEVLRGPQGTLYGASSLGGLLKFVTIDPSTDGVSGRVQAGVNSVDNGDGAGYSLRGAINVPLGNTFAVRASGFTEHDPGYIDNIQTGERGVNKRESNGGRLSALWHPSEAFSIKLSALIQDSKRPGSTEAHVAPGLGDLQQSVLRGAGGYRRNTQAYGATMTAQLGNASLTSATGYSIDEIDTRLDITSFYGGFANSNFSVPGAVNAFERGVTKLSQEVRLSFPVGKTFEWLLGAFYTDEEVEATANVRAVDPTTGAGVGSLLIIHTPSHDFEEYAAFANLTVHFNDRFDVQFGGRLSENEQSFFTVRTGVLVQGFFGEPSPSIVPQVQGKDSPFTYLMIPRLKISPDLMAYARLASGYRPGGPNVNCGLVPCQYSADTTQNYELGLKGKIFDRAISFDASLYYIDWQDIQIPLSVGLPALGYNDNASRAKSQGVELSLESKPLTGLTLAAWVAYNDAELTEAFPPSSQTFGARGDRLPYSSPLSGNISGEQEFPLGSIRAFVGGSVSYVDDRKGVFRPANIVRETFPNYTQTDLLAGVRYDTWTLNVFVNNVTNERGVLRGGLDSFRPNFFTYIQPRTLGLSFSKTY
jgi:iron complex outermembrane recepter protein